MLVNLTIKRDKVSKVIYLTGVIILHYIVTILVLTCLIAGFRSSWYSARLASRDLML